MQVHSELTHACQDPDCRCQESPEPFGDRISPLAKLEQGRFYNSPVIGHLLRFCSWWLVFFGIYASSSVCPCCGTPGCPVGVVASGIMGGFFAAIWTYGKAWLDRVKELIGRLGIRSDRHVTGPD